MTTFVFRGVIMLSSLITGIIIARYLGPEGRGEWALILLNITLLTLISNFGTPAASIYSIGRKKQSDNEILFSLTVYSIIAAGIIVGLNSVLCVLSILYQDTHSYILILLSVAVFPQAVNSQIRHFLLGKKDVFNYNMLMFFETITLMFIVLTIYFSGYLSVRNILIGYLIMSGLSILLHTRKATKYVNWLHFFKSVKFDIIKENIRKGTAFFITGMGGFWSHRANYLMLAYFSNTKAVGLYTVALAIPNIIANIPNQISLVLYPYISAIDAKQDAIDLTSVIVKISVFVILLIYIPIIIWGDQIIVFIYGQEYSGLHLPLKLLFTAMLLDGIGSLMFNHFAGRGKPIYGSYKFVIAITALIIGGFIFIPQFGVTGAAIGKSISAACASSFIIYLFVRDSGLINTFMIKSSDLELFRRILKHEIK